MTTHPTDTPLGTPQITHPMKLIDPTDDQLNEAFAEKVCGWFYQDKDDEENQKWAGYWYSSRVKFEGDMTGDDEVKFNPGFTTSADAVLPWLEKHDWHCNSAADISDPFNQDRAITIYTQTGRVRGVAPTFPRACVIALLRANGVEIEFTKAIP